MMRIRVMVKIAYFLPEFGFELLSNPKARGVTFVKKKIVEKKIRICCGSKGSPQLIP